MRVAKRTIRRQEDRETGSGRRRREPEPVLAIVDFIALGLPTMKLEEWTSPHGREPGECRVDASPVDAERSLREC